MDGAGQETFKGHWYDSPDDAIREYTDEQWRKAQEREREEEIKRQEEKEQRDDDAEVGRALRELEPKGYHCAVNIEVTVSRGADYSTYVRSAYVRYSDAGSGWANMPWRFGPNAISDAIREYGERKNEP
jgi:basic membrane lipoprotein Med (substrate-binding protein (PBP1-ABC) superfamily)